MRGNQSAQRHVSGPKRSKRIIKTYYIFMPRQYLFNKTFTFLIHNLFLIKSWNIFLKMNFFLKVIKGSPSDHFRERLVLSNSNVVAFVTINWVRLFVVITPTSSSSRAMSNSLWYQCLIWHLRLWWNCISLAYSRKKAVRPLLRTASWKRSLATAKSSTDCFSKRVCKSLTRTKINATVGRHWYALTCKW